MKKNILGICLVLLSLNLFSQEIGFCGTPHDEPDFLQSIPTGQLKSAHGNYVVRVFVHFMRRSDGTGGQTMAKMNTSLNFLKNDYAPHQICFSLIGTDEIKSDYLYNQSGLNVTIKDSDHNGKYDELEGNTVSNAINIFLWPDDKLIGKAVNIVGTSLLLGGNEFSTNLVTSHIVSHEMGHCLGLYHTFNGSACQPNNSCPELVNGSNSATCGDYVTDTPADAAPMVYLNGCFSPCEYIYSCKGCSGTVPLKDANGQYYNPDEKLIMSYSSPGCMQYHSPMQGARMRAILENHPVLQNVIVPNNLLLSNTTVSSSYKLYDVLDTITAQNNYIVANNAKLELRAGDEINLLPGFEATYSSNFYGFIDDICGTYDQFNSARNSNSQAMSNEPAKEAKLIVYPNPSTGLFTILTPNTIQQGYISIIDYTGKEIINQPFYPTENLTVDLSGYAKGIYIIHVLSSVKVQREIITLE